MVKKGSASKNCKPVSIHTPTLAQLASLELTWIQVWWDWGNAQAVPTDEELGFPFQGFTGGQREKAMPAVPARVLHSSIETLYSKAGKGRWGISKAYALADYLSEPHRGKSNLFRLKQYLEHCCDDARKAWVSGTRLGLTCAEMDQRQRRMTEASRLACRFFPGVWNERTMFGTKLDRCPREDVPVSKPPSLPKDCRSWLRSIMAAWGMTGPEIAAIEVAWLVPVDIASVLKDSYLDPKRYIDRLHEWGFVLAPPCEQRYPTRPRPRTRQRHVEEYRRALAAVEKAVTRARRKASEPAGSAT